MDIVLLDGGMGQELAARSTLPPTPLWSAEVMERDATLVEAVYRDFIQAGSTVITLNGYAITPQRLRRHMGAEAAERRFVALQRQALRIALSARSGAGHPVALAGCLPPLGGSYHPEAAPGFEESLASYGRILEIQGPVCDLLLAETMCSVAEARAAALACARSGARAWIAFSVNDADGTRLRSGEPLAAGCEAVSEIGAEALLLNCSRPEAIETGLEIVAEAGLPFGAYANGFVAADELRPGGTVAGMAVRTDLGPEAYAAHAMGWIDRGATIVGGCCEVGPAYIGHLHDRIRAEGHTVIRP